MALPRLFICRATASGITAASVPLRPATLRSLRPLLRSAFAKSRPFSLSRPTRATTPKDLIEGGSKFPGSQIPEYLLIYYPGRNRLFFIAFMKVTTIFLAAIFYFALMPNELMSPEGSYLRAASYFICGTVPLTFMAVATHPVLTYVFLRLPPRARTTRHHLERFVRAGPPADTQLRLVTLNFFTRPRYSRAALADMKPCNEWDGLVQWKRDVGHLMAQKKWYHFRPVSKFGTASANDPTLAEGWIWDVVKRYMGKTAKERGVAVRKTS